MKRILLILALLFIQAVHAQDLDNMQPDIRDYDGIEVPAGTFIPVISTQEISTRYCPVGYKVKFISTNDLFMYETNIIPKDTEFYGYIEKLNEPVIGTNGAMKIKISRLVLPDGFEIPVRGYVYTNNDNIIGGGISAPVKLIAMPHYQTPFKKVTLRMTPSMERKMGEHTVIRSGAEGLIILTGPAWITHTLTK
ncbi:MAG: hypothetical protein LBK53_00795 [Heliobacteriaceae bacterium]|jgi:hypothetical protein|nr:hypothetical protein [Heliobacteriaceae bacterium]